MTHRNICKAREMFANGSSIGRIAAALNCSVMSVAYALTQADGAV